MKKLFLLLGVGLLSMATTQLWGQSIITYYVCDSTNGQTYNVNHSTEIVGVKDNGGNGRYTQGDFHLTLKGSCDSIYRFSLRIDELDIACTDTLYIYDGPNTSSPIRAKINNCSGHKVGQRVFVSPTNTSGYLTVRFSATGSGGDGFLLSAECEVPCERVVPVIEEKFYRLRNGVVYDSAFLRDVPVYDTLWNINGNGDTIGITSIDTSYFVGAHLCVGDGVMFKGHGEYTHDHGYYNPSDANTYFVWDMDNDGDTIQGVNIVSITYNDFQKTGCHDMSLSLTDAHGCQSSVYTSVKVRTSVNPIKTIFTLADICNRDSLRVNMGYSGENATLTLREVESAQTVSKINEVRTFIPDGPACPITCYTAPVTFTEYPGRSVRSAADVCSICFNMEHTYLGDMTVSIVCPTGNEAKLFFGNKDPNGSHNTGLGPTDHGSYADMGCPHSSNNGCDTLPNPYGVGFDYCFSRNNNYTLVTGDAAGSISGRPNGDFYITSCQGGTPSNMITVNPPVSYTIPSHFTTGGGSTVTYSSSTKKPSNHEGQYDYYLPYTDFSELIGCPLNGQWELKVCDLWSGDNGWVFNWSLDICGVSMDDDCKYTVGIDSLVWRPDPSPQYHDYDLGHYRGLQVEAATPTVSYISSPDTAGLFPINVFVYDEFGCIWDTTTRITTYWTPKPSLGADTSLCGVDRATLDATDRHTATENYTYLWSPYGQNTPTIITADDAHGSIPYVVSVMNHRNETVCTTRDTINVAVRKQPLPNFIPDPFTFEGCDPLTIHFDNQSVDAIKHLWVFGDGITSELASPTHTYSEGVYTLKYYATSDEGCVDSIISDGGIAVYRKPQASFTWDPVYPSVASPVVHFHNTTPHNPSIRYFWELQYSSDNPLSFETLTTNDAIFDFSRYNNGTVSGNYNVRLVARTDNLAPSGNVVHCFDTAANNILLINDFLQFPNVVTPNGDGINDRFVIQNLVDGLGYPINSLDIYNKWGARVFHRENISSDDDFWDPSDMPDGTYFYRFSARGYNGNIEHNGAIEVIH